MVFLGFLIDCMTQTVCVPREKLMKVKELITNILANKKKKMTVKQMQQICGFLNFLGRCIVPGRAFTRRLYSYTANPKLKPHHHIRVNKEIRSDLEMWITFLRNPAAYSRGFIDYENVLRATEISMFSDASKAETFGLGAVCGKSWTFAQWPANFIAKFDPSIEYLELLALVIGVVNWIHCFKNKRIVLFCDNQSVIAMVNNTTSSCQNCMVLIRILVLESLVHNVRIFAKYIKSKENMAADYLSCMKFKKLTSLASWDNKPTELPERLWPPEKIWVN